MGLGFNKHKSRGFHYRPFFVDEEDERREAIFGEVHEKYRKDDKEDRVRMNFKGKFGERSRAKRDHVRRNRIMRLMIILGGLIMLAIYIAVYVDISKSIQRIIDFFNG